MIKNAQTLKKMEDAILKKEGRLPFSYSILRDLTGRGLKLGRLTIVDGHLGIWSALGELYA